MAETEQTSHTSDETTAIHEAAGKYLTFVLEQEEYGIEILKVREIIGMVEVTVVPQAPHYIKGVINLRGKLIPVADLRLKFGMEEKVYDEETCIIVLDVSGRLIGAIVDTVSEVLDLSGDQIEPAPDFGSKLDTEYILGMGKIGDRVKILLDIDKVFTIEGSCGL